MTLIEQFLQKFEPISGEAIKKAFEAKIDAAGIDNITVEDVIVDFDGEITVYFADDEGEELDITFMIDEEDGALALILDDEDAEDFIEVDLDSLNPPIKRTAFGSYIDLTNLDWLSPSTLMALLEPEELMGDADESPNVHELPPPVMGKGGHNWNESIEVYGEISEGETIELDEARKIVVIRGGKKVRLPVVRRVRKKILTGKKKAAIRRAVRKRKVKQSRINRKRKRSLKVRKRVGVKKPKLSKFQKASGTANRKR